MNEALRPLIYLAVMMLAMGGFLLWSRRRVARVRAASPETTAGAIAERLGLRVVRGSPETNLAMPGSQVTEVVLEGEPYGVPTLVRYLYRTDEATTLGQVFLGQTKTNIWYESRIEVASPASRGRFEVRLARPHPDLHANSAFDTNDPLPRRRFESELDGLLRIEADDGELPALLAPHLGPLLSMGYVHVAGETGRVFFSMAHSTHGWRGVATANAYGFSQVDAIVHLLVSISAALEGRPAPSQVAAALVPSQASSAA